MPLFSIIPPLIAVPTWQWAAAGRAFSGVFHLTVSYFSQSYQLFPAFSSWRQATTFNLQAGVVARPSCRQSLLPSTPSLQGGNAPSYCSSLFSVAEQILGRCRASILAEDFSNLFNSCAAWLCSKSQLFTGAEWGQTCCSPLLHNGLESGVDRYPESFIEIQNLASLSD